MAGSVEDISEADFESKVSKGALPALVDFWAPWCGPCKGIAPLLEQLAGEYKGKVNFFKVNVDTNQKLAAELKVSAIPNLVIFKGCAEVARVVGQRPKEELIAALEKAL